MGEVERIRGFLAAVRRRLLVREGLAAAGWAATILGVLILALSLLAAAIGPAGFWPTLTGWATAGMLVGALAWGLARPAVRLRSDLAAARSAGALMPGAGPAPPPTMASDLVSIVELRSSAREPRPDAISSRLVGAFEEQVATGLLGVEPRRLVPLGPAARALGAAGLTAAALVAAAMLWPLAGRGLRTLVHHPSRFEGAAISAAPLVGDVRITYEYPAYTGLPPRTVEGSTGDAAAVKGTHVRIETRPLRSARRGLLLLGEAGEKGEVNAKLADGVLRAELTLNEDASYRFWLEPAFGRAVREERSHHLTAEPDAPPRVEISGPADRLELPTPRPIEIGYSASDDFGVGPVDLMVRIGDRPEQRIPLREGAGARAVQGRTVWDPTTAGLRGAERIAYRVEARDRDTVSGAKVASSRTLYVVIQNPHEGLEDRLDRQRELHEKLIGDLAERLERGPASVAPFAPGTDANSVAERLGAFASVHEAEESHLALLGQLIDAERREGGMTKALRGALAGIADRLEKVLREEAQALGAAKGKPPAAALARLDALAPRHVAELESDVLLLDDLIGRQRLEDLASLGKELTDAHQRLQDLLERYKKTKDEGLRRQLEREARDLRARIADLAQRIAEVKSRNDVPDEWRNLPDVKNIANEARKLDDMLQKGDDGDLEKALAQLGDQLRAMRKMLDQNAEGFGAERFPQENRVVADLMKKIGDIEGDERALQKETQGLADRQEAEMEKRWRGELDELLKKEADKAERLKQRLGAVQTGDPESSLSEEVNRARESAKQIRRLLAERDLAEAKGEAERAADSLDRAGEHLSEMSEARRGHRPGEAERDKAGEAVGEARRLAQEIAEDLGKIAPRPSDMMSPQDREAARGQAERQGALGKRTDEIAGEASKRLGKMPGMEKAESELRGASSRMRQAGDLLKRDESKGAATAERDAADRLAKLRDSMQERTMGGGRPRHDPVRIPGADESTAPRAWRQELLDAMKERAPERFRDEVRRYYEELVK
jgi:hypothetical protein